MHALEAHLGQLASCTDQPVHDQHVVSEVLLKRFAEPVPGRQGRQLHRIKLARPGDRPRPVPPSGCGVVKDFVRYASGSAEKLWAVTEDKLGLALQACEDGTLFAHPKYVRLIKHAIALHYVRSLQTAAVHERTWSTVRAEYRAAWLNSPRFLQTAFYRKTGLYASGTHVLEAVADDLLQQSEAWEQSGALLRARLEDLLQQAMARADRTCLEVLRADVGEFLIGDNPALAIRHDRPGIGPLQGIALDDANAVLLPLGPKYVASFGPRDTYGTVPEEAVNHLNRLQIHAARTYVYCRPGSGLEESVREAISAGR